MSAPKVDVLAVCDCHACGGSGCFECDDSGVVKVICLAPPAEFTVRADEDGFEQDRQECPCYEGIKINHGVDQCTHPDNRGPENWCDRQSCPLLRARIGSAS
ncbi:MAG: hypothetical protein KGO96_14060 [Elusimicrobia bacterium]|nr:hypothetical protein [Elusimicrobiota bacterium]